MHPHIVNGQSSIGLRHTVAGVPYLLAEQQRVALSRLVAGPVCDEQPSQVMRPTNDLPHAGPVGSETHGVVDASPPYAKQRAIWPSLGVQVCAQEVPCRGVEGGIAGLSGFCIAQID